MDFEAVLAAFRAEAVTARELNCSEVERVEGTDGYDLVCAADFAVFEDRHLCVRSLGGVDQQIHLFKLYISETKGDLACRGLCL